MSLQELGTLSKTKQNENTCPVSLRHREPGFLYFIFLCVDQHLPITPTSQPLATTILFSTSIILTFQDSTYKGYHSIFFLHLTCPDMSIRGVANCRIPSFSWQSNIPLYMYVLPLLYAFICFLVSAF